MTDEMLGVDIKLNNFDIIYNSLNDVNVNTPKENITQAIINRLMTPKGFFTKHPLYGSDLYRIQGMGNSDSTLIYCRNVVYETLLQEPRIDKIVTITVNFRDVHTISIYLELTTITSPELFNIVWDYFIQ